MIFGIDGNWYLNRAYAIAGTKDPEQAVTYLFLSLMFKDALAVKAKRVFVAFDGPEVFRYKLYKKYKGNRDKHKENRGKDDTSNLIYSKSLPFLQGVLTLLEIPWEQHRDKEADDVLASSSYVYDKIVLGAQDKDLYGHLREGVRLFDSKIKVGSKYITHETVRKKLGIDPKHMELYQTLIGDSGDNIPGLKGVGPKTAQHICNTYGSINEWYKAADAETKLMLKRNKDKLALTRKLVTLRRDCPAHALQIPADIATRGVKVPNSVRQYLEFLYSRTKSLF